MPNDHVSSLARLASHPAAVSVIQPSWAVELLGVLLLTLALFTFSTLWKLYDALHDAREANEQAELWKEFALAPETSPTVRVERNGVGFKCSTWNVRQEWERAVAQECDRFGHLLLQARATP
jgi:hypothetical protein